MNAVDQWLFAFFQGFRRGDIGLDHEFFDQPVRVEPLGHDHLVDLAIRCEQDLALRHVEIKRLAAVPLSLEHSISVPQRLQDGFQQRAGGVVGIAVNRCLGLLIGQFGRALDHHPVKLVADFAPFGGKHHPQRQRRPVLALAQRTQIVGNPLRQHRNDPVREIGGVAALQRFPVERRAGTHIPGHICNRDGNDDAAGIVRGGVFLGEDRVIMILGVAGVDGDQRDIPPVLASCGKRGGLCLVSSF